MKTIRDYREAIGLTQVQLAHEVGVTPSTVYKWEAGKVVPDVIRLRKLAQVFDVSSDEIALVGVDVDPEEYLGKLAA